VTEPSRTFTVGEARALVPAVREHAAEILTIRADLTELAFAINAGIDTPLGGVAEAKAFVSVRATRRGGPRDHPAS